MTYYREAHDIPEGASWAYKPNRFYQIEAKFEFRFRRDKYPPTTGTGTSRRFDGTLTPKDVADLTDEAKYKALMNANTPSDASNYLHSARVIWKKVLVFRQLKDLGKYKKGDRAGTSRRPARLAEPKPKAAVTAWRTANNGRQYIPLKDAKGHNYRWMDRAGNQYTNREYVSHIQKGEPGRPIKR